MGGIEADPTKPAFRHTIVRPQPGGKLTHVHARFESLYGNVATEWHWSGEGQFRLSVTIPANTTASVHVPGRDVRLADALDAPPLGGQETGSAAADHGAAAASSDLTGCELVAESDNGAEYFIGSGQFTFVSRL